MVRGNEPSIKFRYLQIRGDYDMTTKLVELYPEHNQCFKLYENALAHVAQFILNAYIKRFIEHQWIVVPQEEYKVMQICHSWHLQNKSENIIHYRKVVDVLNDQPATKLNKMIRRCIQESGFFRL